MKAPYRKSAGRRLDVTLWRWPLWTHRPVSFLVFFLLPMIFGAIARVAVLAPVGAAAAMVVVAVGGGAGCVSSAQATNAIVPGVNFAICVITTYDKEAAGVPIAQVVADEIAACGGDAASIVTVLDAHEGPAKHAHVAHEKVVSP